MPKDYVIKKVDKRTEHLLREIYKIRYEVYCHKCGFIAKEDYPHEMEYDEYDRQSQHFAAFNSDNEVVGAARLILPGDRPLPIEKYCPKVKSFIENLHGAKYAEVSRFVIDYKRTKAIDTHYGVIPILKSEEPDETKEMNSIALGLYKNIYHESLRQGIVQLFVLMEKSLDTLLLSYGFEFEQIGDPIEFYGTVNPYRALVPSIIGNLYKNFPWIYKYFHRGIS